MLSVADADLVRRDTALPGLATLLDPDAFVAALRRAVPDADLGMARITYVKYKPGTNCLAACRLEVNRKPVDVYGKAFAVGARNKTAKALRDEGVAGPLGKGRLVLEELGIVVSAFPNDSKIKALDALTSGASRQEMLRELFPHRPDLCESSVERLIYKPERRWVGRLLTGGVAQAALKVFTDREYPAAVRNAGLFRSQGPLQIAPLLASSTSYLALAYAWVPDPVLSGALADPALDLRNVSRTGAALAALHSQDADGLPASTPGAVAAALLEDAGSFGRIFPALGQRAARLADEIVAKLSQAPAMNRPLHGDFHARQVLLGESTVTLLDLDSAVRGDPAADLGNFVAHLERERMRGNLSAERVRTLAQALLEGYRCATLRPLPARIELHAAAALFRLSPQFFRYREPNWPALIESSLECSQAFLQEAGFGQ